MTFASLFLILSTTKKHLTFTCLLTFPTDKGWCLRDNVQLASSCINMSSFSSSPCASLKCLNYMHFGNRSPSATSYISAEITVITPSFFDAFIIDPLPIVRNIPECPFPSECTTWPPSMHIDTSPFLSIDYLSGMCLVFQIYPARCRNFPQS